MKTKLLLKKLSAYFPKKIADSRDYIGIQVNKIKEETNTIFLCLDFDEITYDYIIKNHLEDKIDLIITHHPFIFGKKNKVLKFDEKKRLLYEKMEQLNIPIYSYHTNFDTGKNGMNDALAESLDLQNIKQLQLEPMARGGELKEEMDVIEFSHYALEKLKVDYGTLINEGKNPDSIYVTGNTAIDALKTTVRSEYTHEQLRWAAGSRLIMITAHRRENLGEPMKHMFRAIRRVCDEHPDVKAIYPALRNFMFIAMCIWIGERN